MKTLKKLSLVLFAVLLLLLIIPGVAQAGGYYGGSYYGSSYYGSYYPSYYPSYYYSGYSPYYSSYPSRPQVVVQTGQTDCSQHSGNTTDALIKELLLRQLLNNAGGAGPAPPQQMQGQPPLTAEEIARFRQLLNQAPPGK